VAATGETCGRDGVDNEDVDEVMDAVCVGEKMELEAGGRRGARSALGSRCVPRARSRTHVGHAQRETFFQPDLRR
jgi:hypothetical protein